MIRHGYYLPTLGAFGDMGLAREAASLWIRECNAVAEPGRFDGASVYERGGTFARVTVVKNLFDPNPKAFVIREHAA